MSDFSEMLAKQIAFKEEQLRQAVIDGNIILISFLENEIARMKNEAGCIKKADVLPIQKLFSGPI